jgi:hypothetical protein
MACESGRDSRLAKIIFPALLLTTVLARLPPPWPGAGAGAGGFPKAWAILGIILEGDKFRQRSPPPPKMPSTLMAAAESPFHYPLEAVDYLRSHVR